VELRKLEKITKSYINFYYFPTSAIFLEKKKT